MIRLATRIEALERKSGGANGPARVLCLTGADTSGAAIAEFLAPYRIDPDEDDTLLIIVSSLEWPEGAEPRRYPDLPVGFVGPVPDWIKALPIYQDNQA